MEIQGRCGQQTITDSSNLITARLGKRGQQIVSNLHGKHAESTLRKNRFYGSNGATPSVTTVALATTYTGLCLYNPVGSGVNLILDKVGYSFLVAFPAAATIGLMGGYSDAGIVTASAADSPGASCFLDGATTPKGKCALSATLVGTPKLLKVFGEGLTAAITTVPQGVQYLDMEGSIVIPPGAYVAIYTSTVSGAASLAGSFEWSEELI